MHVDQQDDLVNNTRERTGGVNDDGMARNVLFRLMQAHCKLTFVGFATEIGWVPCHSLIQPAVHRVQIDIEDKDTIKQLNEFGEIARPPTEKGDRRFPVGGVGSHFLYIPNPVLGQPENCRWVGFRSKRSIRFRIASIR